VTERTGKRWPEIALSRVIADSLRYGFTVGRVRVLEGRLVGQATYERLIETRSLPEQRRILGETIYGGYLEAARTADDVERGLDAALADLYASFLGQANLPRSIAEFFLVRHQFANLKGRLKAAALGVEPAGMLTDLGGVAAEAFEGPPERLPPRARRAERAIRAALARDDGILPAEEIEDAVDRELYRELAAIARDADVAFMSEIVELEVDIANLRVFIRARRRDRALAEVRARFLPGGRIPIQSLVVAYRLAPVEAAARLSARRPLTGVGPEVFANPALFDLAAARLLSQQARAGLRIAIGPEPVIGYVLEREAEARALCAVLIGSLARVPPDQLRERSRYAA
jgi:V/A-type H+-transporting ATPase subunit C